MELWLIFALMTRIVTVSAFGQGDGVRFSRRHDAMQAFENKKKDGSHHSRGNMSTARSAARAKTKGKRMLRNALDAYGDEDTSLSEWNARKKKAVEKGEWLWKERVVNGNAAIKSRFDREDVQLTAKTRYEDTVEEEVSSIIHSGLHEGQLLGPRDGFAEQCCWGERIGGKRYHCTNVLPRETKKRASSIPLRSTSVATSKRLCLWHAKECRYSEHAMETSRVIEIPNEYGMCLRCYEVTAGTLRATLQKVPARIGALKIPGVCETDAGKVVKPNHTVKLSSVKSLAGAQAARQKLDSTSVCAWQKEHSEIKYVWRCTNRVLMHPVLRGSFLPFCGFHAPRCIHNYGTKEQVCPLIERKNRFGMCRNHLEAHLSSALSFEERQTVLLLDSDVDVPGVKECKKEKAAAPVLRHPLAPKYPPPSSQASNRFSLPIVPTHTIMVLPSRSRRAAFEKVIKKAREMVKTTICKILDHPNRLSIVVKAVVWRVQFLRRAEVVAIRIQRVFRGRRARRRVMLLLYEQAALNRIKACRVLQRFVRGFLGRCRFVLEHEDLHHAVPRIQPLLRGALTRKRFRELCAAIRLQRNYRLYRQRLLARAFQEEVAYFRALQRQANVNYVEMENQMSAFRRLRARKVLRAHLVKWKVRQEMHAQEAAKRLRALLGTVKIQRQWRRYRQYVLITKRYKSAQLIQKRARGWLTRCLWLGDPGVHFVPSFVNPRNNFRYGKTVIEAQTLESYSYPSRRIRTHFGALTIQRIYRGHLGRLAANTRWASMLKRWEWLGISPMDLNGQPSDCMTVGHEQYGFLLPSFAYHRDKRRHMRRVADGSVSKREHAYKYQYILDLISDRDGKRGWSLAIEERQARQQKDEQERLRVEEAREQAKEAEIARNVQVPTKYRDPLAQSMPIAKAVFPVGSYVDVVGKMEGQRIVRGAKIIGIHNEKGPSGERSARFDVHYTEPLRNSFGRLEDSTERQVSVARLRHATSLVLPEMRRMRTLALGPRQSKSEHLTT